MNSNEKRWVVLLVAVLIIAVVLIVVLVIPKGKDNDDKVEPTQQNEAVNEEKYTTQLESGSKLNTSETFNKTKTYGDLEFTNIQFSATNGVSALLADITNKGTKTHEDEVVMITIIGENDETITQMKAIVGKVEPGKTIKLNAVATADIANAKDFKIEADKKD